MNHSEQTRLLGESSAFLEVLEQVSLLAPLNKPVLVIGERGTGKELIAERLHFLSERWDKPLIKMNCAAVSDSLLESELFGHEAGAFTGASRKHAGRFERADSGSLFLDELAATSTRVQEKLLRVIEYGEFERLGGSQTLTVNTRLVAATNEDLPSLAAANQFRFDLLDRLSFDVITLPPLRFRSEDILLLAENFAMNMCQELGQDFFPGFADAAVDTLLNYTWPGNVRELKNVVERSVYRHQGVGEPIEEINLDPFESPYRPLVLPAITSNHSAEISEAIATLGNKKDQALPLDLKQEVKELEVSLLKQALEQAQYKQAQAAALLGLSYHQLRAYLRKYKL